MQRGQRGLLGVRRPPRSAREGSRHHWSPGKRSSEPQGDPPPHAHQDDDSEENGKLQVLARRRRHRSPAHTVDGNVRRGSCCRKQSRSSSKKLKIEPPYGPVVPRLGVRPAELTTEARGDTGALEHAAALCPGRGHPSARQRTSGSTRRSAPAQRNAIQPEEGGAPVARSAGDEA